MALDTDCLSITIEHEHNSALFEFDADNRFGRSPELMPFCLKSAQRITIAADQPRQLLRLQSYPCTRRATLPSCDHSRIIRRTAARVNPELFSAYAAFIVAAAMRRRYILIVPRASAALRGRVEK